MILDNREGANVKIAYPIDELGKQFPGNEVVFYL